MSDFHSQLEPDNAFVRRSLYAGRLYLLPAVDESRALAAAVRQAVEEEFGQDGPPREAQFRLSADEFFQRIGRLRKRFYTRPEHHVHAARLMDALGFRPDEHAFDPIRLRVVPHEGHLNPAAAPIYYGHRDTWYANPQSIITWWIPLHDVGCDETFEFFPEEFNRPVDNDSQVFDFDAWVRDGQQKRIGWQDRETGRTARYPQLLEEPRGRRIPVACRAGDILLFSAQHLHRTRINLTGRTRFSLDFRTVHCDDHDRGIGARNVDNRSTGSSLVQFVSGRELTIGGTSGLEGV